METIIPFLITTYTQIIGLFKGTKKLLVSVGMVLLLTGIINFNPIYNYIMPQDIVKEYLDKSYLVENSLNDFKRNYNADEVSIAILHNGVVSIADPKFHLLKFSILFSVGEHSRYYKMKYLDVPISVWIENFNSMLRNKYYLIEDAETDSDALVRQIYKSHNNHTSIYLPLYKNGNILGYVIVSYRKTTKISDNDIHSMIRSTEQIESVL